MTEVIIVGGGIAGCSAAYYLAADGVDVTLLERQEPNALASGANAGSLHAQIPREPFLEFGPAWARRFASMIPFCLESIRLWLVAAEALDADLEVSQDGGVIVAANAEQLRQIEAKSRIERAAGLPMEMLDKEALRQLAPYVSERMLGGAYCPVEGKANPLVAATAFANAAGSLGARIMRGCEVTGISPVAGGYRVHSTRGDFTAPRVINAAGAGAGRVAAFVDAHFRIEAYPIQLSVTEPVAPLVRHLLYSGSDPLTLKQTRIGTVLIGGGWPSWVDGRGRAQVSLESLTRNLATALEVVPALAPVSIVRSWAAVVNGTEDWLPVLGEVPGAPGFFMNHVPWMGFTGGPAGGRIVASLVQGKQAPVDFDVAAFMPH